MKILISIIYDLRNLEELRAVYQNFFDKGYVIEQFEVGPRDVQIDSLPSLVGGVLEKEDYRGEEHEIVILSNIKHLLFSWYRCYNTLVNDYIYFIDEKENDYIRLLSHQELVKRLSDFQGIESEYLEGKIYLNLNDTNYNNISMFLFSSNHLRFFDVIKNFDFEKNKATEYVNKRYTIRDLEYTFMTDSNIRVETYKLHHKDFEVNIDEKYIETILKGHFQFLPYFILFIYSLNSISKIEKDNFLVGLFRNVKKMEKEKQRFLHEFFMTILKNKSFKDKIYFLSLLVLLGIDKGLLNPILETLKNDNNNIEYHYPLLMNSLFYVTKEGLREYPNVYLDRQYVFEKILNNIEKKLLNHNLNAPRKLSSTKIPKKIAIITGQLLSEYHSPSRVALNRAKYLKKFSSSEVKIFVDDMFVFSPNEIGFPYVYSSAKSSELSNYHQEFFSKESVDIYYSNSDLSRIDRINEQLREIDNFNPDIIFIIGNDYSIVGRLLYPNYPIIIQRTGAIPITKWCDVYLGQEVQFQEYNMKPLCKYIDPDVRFDEFELPNTNISRKAFNLNNGDFLLVTVGNRMNVDINKKFLDEIIPFLVETENAKWLLVGANTHSLITKYYSQLIEKQKIIFIGYEKDLASLLLLCDVYINPDRIGGGFSGLLAMKLGIPILSPPGAVDITNHIGQENAVDLRNYKSELNRLKVDLKYRNDKGRVLKEKYKLKMDNNRAVNELISYFQEANYLFSQRI